MAITVLKLYIMYISMAKWNPSNTFTAIYSNEIYSFHQHLNEQNTNN